MPATARTFTNRSVSVSRREWETVAERAGAELLSLNQIAETLLDAYGRGRIAITWTPAMASRYGGDRKRPMLSIADDVWGTASTRATTDGIPSMSALVETLMTAWANGHIKLTLSATGKVPAAA